MAVRLEVIAQPRTVTGKKTRFLRRDGEIPANIYGHGVESISVQVSDVSLRRLLARAAPTSLVNVKLQGTALPYTVMVREVQRDPRTGQILHVDFYTIRMFERIRSEVAVHMVGTAPGVKSGAGTLNQIIRTIEVEGLPDELPAALDVDISGLEFAHDTVYVRDLKVPAGVTVHADPDSPVASIAPERVLEEDEEAPSPEPERVVRERGEEA